MKIWCDVCDKEEASVFCSADEAALCAACDRRVHHANKLASKHLRFSLVNPTFKNSPLCDICKERRALLFCQEDRAILCRECDLPVHKSNEYTKKHNRFLLTGVKLSPSSSVYNPSPSSSTCAAGDATIIDGQKRIRSSYSSVTKASTSAVSNGIFSSNSIPSTMYQADDNHISDNCSISTSSISEYLMETLPGWRVDDFLDPSSSATTNNVFCKTYDQFLPFGDQDLESNMGFVSSEDLAIWVPEVPPQSPQIPLHSPQNGFLNGFKESTEAKSLKVGRKWREDGFTVPQISRPSVKKTRNFWVKWFTPLSSLHGWFCSFVIKL
ncbi:Zinc finger, B-box [Melia azedarach]|uniref:Zinc finger, B-box n=2 Tax=Melia azedarach TaxID=155640 RepID=A0ACC1Y072_MELAZ|nr:Zinc finger, B-box [Melia azedarach]